MSHSLYPSFKELIYILYFKQLILIADVNWHRSFEVNGVTPALQAQYLVHHVLNSKKRNMY